MTDIGANFPFPRKPSWEPLTKILKDLKKLSRKKETVAMSGAAKPVLRGFLARHGYRMLAEAAIISTAAAAAWQFLWVIPRQKQIEEFYKSYDPEKHYLELKAKGYFDHHKERFT